MFDSFKFVKPINQMRPKNKAIFVFTKINTIQNKIIMKTMFLCLFLSISFAFVSEKTGWLEIDWKIIFIPALLVLQIIIIGTALKNRYKKH
ncbi:hypothetical protein BSF42_10650 [Flavobacterium sp. ACN6]|nr:hypothetical protein BSF42_10650 [Flavobacterium sp. ACN6]